MHQDLGVSVALAGLVTMIIMSGTIASSLASERLTRRFGAGLVTTVSVGMTAAALVGFSFSSAFWMICLWAIPYGLGAGAVDAALNNYVALHYAAKHMNWLHSFWGVGASISPFIMSYALTNGFGWGNAYLTVGIIQAVLTVALIVSLPLWGRVHAQANTADAPVTNEQDAPSGAVTHVPIMQALRIPGVILVLLAFFAYSALETTTALWSATYLVGHRGIDTATAAAFRSEERRVGKECRSRW